MTRHPRFTPTGVGKTLPDGYRRQIEAFRRFRPGPLGQVRLLDLERYKEHLENLGYTAGSVRAMLTPLRALFGYLHSLGLVLLNIGAALSLPRVSENAAFAQRIVPPEVIEAIIAAAPDAETRLMFRLLRETGFRASELLSLTWENVTPENGRWLASVCGKGGKWHSVSISAALYGEMEKLKARQVRQVGDPPENRALFNDDGTTFEQPKLSFDNGHDPRENRPNPMGNVLDPRENSEQAAQTETSRRDAHLFPITRQTLHKRIKKPVRTAARESPGFSAHWFRHAFVSHLLDAGLKLHEVQELAGHASLGTTTRYAHVKDLPCPGEVLQGA